MPGYDGTGPLGQGPMTGRGRSVGYGDYGRGVRAGFVNCPRYVGSTSNAPRGVGGVETCQCPKCGHKEPHARGIPCDEVACTKCGTQMKGDYCMPDQQPAKSEQSKKQS